MKKTWLFAFAVLTASLHALSAAETPAYVPGISFAKEEGLRNICAIAISKGDSLLVAADGRVRFFDPESGQCTRSFATGLKRADALATDGEVICLLQAQQEQKAVEINGRKMNQPIPVSVVCKRFTWDGQPMEDLNLKDAQSASAADIVGDKLYVADRAARMVRIYDLKTGTPAGTVGKNLRVCCGILGFTVDRTNGDLLVANLGAFKLQRYAADSSLKSEFGKRGSADGDFHGCCNPVNVGVLSGGNLVLVEKDPSRVLICRPNGQLVQVLSGLQELVEGCNRVSMAVDSKGRIYLGVNSKTHFVVQYVPKAG